MIAAPQAGSSRTESADVVRAVDPSSRTLSLSPDIEPGQRAFQLATQIARLDAADLIESFANHEGFGSEEARALARIGFASYFAGSVLLPYRRFLAEAEALRYDIELLSQHFRVSFETVAEAEARPHRQQAETANRQAQGMSVGVEAG